MIITLRSALFYFGFALWTFLWGSVVLLFVLLPRGPRSWACGFWGRVSVYWLRWACGVRFRVTGEENIPKCPCVIVANHQSALETLLLWVIFRRISYVLKRELFQIPVFGWALRLSWPIGIDRRQGKRAMVQVLEEGKERLAAGFHVLIFPEGTRHPCGEVGEFSNTAAGLAVRARVPLLPVALNAGCFWPRDDWRKRPGIVEIRIAPPIMPGDDKAGVLTAKAHAWISQAVAQMDGGSAAPPPRPGA